MKIRLASLENKLYRLTNRLEVSEDNGKTWSSAFGIPAKCMSDWVKESSSISVIEILQKEFDDMLKPRLGVRLE